MERVRGEGVPWLRPQPIHVTRAGHVAKRISTWCAAGLRLRLPGAGRGARHFIGHQIESGARGAVLGLPGGNLQRAGQAYRGAGLELQQAGNGFILKQALADFYQRPLGEVTLGNGSNDILELIGRAFLQPGDEAIYAQHSFAVYPLVVQAVGATGITVPAVDWGHDLEAMAKAVTPKTRVIFIANPNNPTGTWVEKDALDTFFKAVPENVLIVLDEAYGEYEEDLVFEVASEQLPSGFTPSLGEQYQMQQPDGQVVVRDRLRGEVTFDLAQIDDQVLLKSDGMPTYHLANVVDDHLMEITHVIRAEEWISSTPKHVLLYQAFGWDEPAWHHMPLLRNNDKSKISKRKNPVSINYYRDAGILPHALCNFLGLMGWTFGDDREKFTLAEMVAAFSWDRIALGGPVFNLDKLTWLNEKYIHELSNDELADALIAWRLRKDYLAQLVPLVRQRIKRLDDFVPATTYFLDRKSTRLNSSH